jgi:low temperature requirement protein LtrA
MPEFSPQLAPRGRRPRQPDVPVSVGALRGIRHRHDLEEEKRAGFIELFFDLVFVVVVTRLVDVLAAHLTLGGAGRTLFLLLVAYWAWIHTTWTTNWFDVERRIVRLVLLLGMLASLLGAIAIPEAFGDRALLLVIGYVGIQTVRNAFAVLATDPDDTLYLPLVRILAWTAWVSVLWFTGAFAGDGLRAAVWITALAADYAGPYLGHWTPGLGRTSPRDWDLEPNHFIERLELFLIIALGETIVATGVTASELPLGASRICAVVVTFALAVALWWLYFDFHADRALRVLRAAAGERGRLGRDLSYVHIPIVAGVILTAVGNGLVVAHPAQPLHDNELLALAGGPIVYLLGSVGFKLRVLGAYWGKRVVAAASLAAVVALGQSLPALAVCTLILLVLVVLAALEAMENYPELEAEA